MASCKTDVNAGSGNTFFTEIDGALDNGSSGSLSTTE